MSKLKQGLAAAFIGLAGVGILALDMTAPVDTKGVTTEVVDLSARRLAVASWSCLRDAGVNADKIHEVCKWATKRGDWIVCLTDRQAVHACERDPETIPDEYQQRYGVCRYQEDGEWRTWAGWAPIGEAAPVGWTCQVILPRGWWLTSMGGVDDALVLALRSKCGWQDSDISGDSWGACPHCLMWPEGCGPCRKIADQYGRDWAGHECECDGTCPPEVVE